MIGVTRVHETELVDELLNRLPVTDRVFHDLKHTQPLVETLVRTIQGTLETGRILIIAPNALLPLALTELGYSVEIWQVPNGNLTEEVSASVKRAGTLHYLLADPPTGVRYDLIVLPFVLETAPDEPPVVLERLRRLLLPGGHLVIAFRHAGALEHRLIALSGRPAIADPAARSSAVSYSWPLTLPVRLFGRDEFRLWCQRTGLRIIKQAYVIDARPAVAVHAMSLPNWLAAEAAYAAKRRVAPLRSASVAVLTPLEVMPQFDGDATVEVPHVTVVLRGREQSRIVAALARLNAQTYPPAHFDVIVLHPVGLTFQNEPASDRATFLPCADPESPEATNLAVTAAKGRVLAFTDELCEVSRNWVEAGAQGIEGATVAIAGPVRASAESATPFLVMPGARQIEKDDGWFSTSNAFFRKDVIVNAGDSRRKRAEYRGLTTWASDLAYGLVELGYGVQFEPSVEVSRVFPFVPAAESRLKWMIDEFRRARELPSTVRRWPTLRKKLLAHGVFASRRTMYFDLMLLGLALSAVRRRPVFAALAFPFAISNRTYLPFFPPRLLKPAARNLRGLLVRHGLWFAGLAVGSIKARRVVL